MGFSEVLLASPGSVLGLVLVLLLVYLVYKYLSSDPGPPGPKPLPLLGNILQLDLKRPYLTLSKLSQQYGSVFTVWLGPHKVVVLSGYKTVKEALVKNAVVFGERGLLPIFVGNNAKNCRGVKWSNSEPWKEVRRFALFNLRDFGMGKKSLESRICEEAQCLCEVVKSFKGKPFDTKAPVNCAISNVICSLVYGSRFDYDDPEFTTLVSHALQNMHLTSTPSIQIYNLYPWLGRLVPNRNKIYKFREKMSNQNLKFFKRLRETLNPQMCRGFVDAFLLRQSKESGVPDTPFHEENLVQTVMQLFSAGTDSTATTLRWTLLLMAKYPHIQDQVREEITRVIGARQVKLEDRKYLSFTDAVIHETQRLINVIPLALPHETNQDITFQGHFIKKGTTIWPLLTSVHHDESEWEKPHSFYPEHFLNKDGSFKKRDAFMPFSAGRRICLGEGLARMELFIVFVTLMQRFQFTAPPGVTEEDLDLTAQRGLAIRHPMPHELCAVPCD
ncbi:hypothetical protein WMY93_015280 [Mugilogobius chulae]|uniref:Cytochrome P450 n=1 Tax=Mugilogobius chulae TaxID=88201 RepID=A0AAW0P1T4_9GOBI